MQFLIDGDAADARPTVLLAHGAGAAMDSDFMNAFAAGLAATGLRVARFEFSYMAARRSGGSRRPPPKAETLGAEYLAAVAALEAPGPLVIGGKSMGGRVASLVADELFAARRISGLLCLGYPFHPARKPDRPRLAALGRLVAPALLCQGSRDPLGSREDVASYALSPRISLFWIEDGDHDLRPRKRVTGESHEQALSRAVTAAAAWVRSTSVAR